MLISSRMISGAVSLPPTVKTSGAALIAVDGWATRISRSPTRSRSIRAFVIVP